MSEITCDGKHTKYQPPVAELKCPTCGVASPHFAQFELPDLHNDKCTLLHSWAQWRCAECGVSTNGFAIDRHLQATAPKGGG